MATMLGGERKAIATAISSSHLIDISYLRHRALLNDSTYASMLVICKNATTHKLQLYVAFSGIF